MYRPSSGNKAYILGGIAGVGVCLLIFLLIPLSQMLSESPEKTESLEAVSVSLPPPPPPPDPPPPPPPEEQEPPELQEPLQMPTLDQIEVTLNPGTGGTLAVGLQEGFSFETEDVEDLRDLFDFGELDEIPRIVQRGTIEYPNALRRAGTEGEVQLVVIVDEQGRVTVDEVVEFTHRPFVQPAIRGAEATRFSTPRRGGEPVRARYRWTIRFSLSN